MINPTVRAKLENYARQLEMNVSEVFSAHFSTTAKHIAHDEYQYDPTDDGPEIGIIRRESLIQNFEVCGA